MSSSLQVITCIISIFVVNTKSGLRTSILPAKKTIKQSQKQLLNFSTNQILVEQTDPKAKVKKPSTFINTYNAGFEIINKENFREFVLGSPKY